MRKIGEPGQVGDKDEVVGRYALAKVNKPAYKDTKTCHELEVTHAQDGLAAEVSMETIHWNILTISRPSVQPGPISIRSKPFLTIPLTKESMGFARHGLSAALELFPSLV